MEKDLQQLVNNIRGIAPAKRMVNRPDDYADGFDTALAIVWQMIDGFDECNTGAVTA